MKLLETAALVSWPILAVALAVRMLPSLGWRSLLIGAAGYIAADFVAGTVHWFADSIDVSRWGWLTGFVGPFREHHRHPGLVTQHDFTTTNGTNAAATVPLLLLGLLVPAGLPGVFLLTLALGLGISTQTHKWSHQASPPTLVRWLQHAGLLLSPAAHDRHHQGANNSAYCVTSGALNRLCDTAGLWRKLERLAAKCGVGSRCNAP
jgi:plasmanylethanolamine desaturase